MKLGGVVGMRTLTLGPGGFVPFAVGDALLAMVSVTTKKEMRE